MIVADAPPALYCPAFDRALGADAFSIGAALTEISARSTSLSDTYPQWDEAIVKAVEDARLEGRAALPEAMSAGSALLGALPLGTPAPEVVVESDGQIGFDWDLDRRRTLSLNVGRGGMLGYSALIGVESTYGRIQFDGSLDRRIADLLRAVLAE